VTGCTGDAASAGEVGFRNRFGPQDCAAAAVTATVAARGASAGGLAMVLPRRGPQKEALGAFSGAPTTLPRGVVPVVVVVIAREEVVLVPPAGANDGKSILRVERRWKSCASPSPHEGWWESVTPPLSLADADPPPEVAGQITGSPPTGGEGVVEEDAARREKRLAASISCRRWNRTGGADSAVMPPPPLLVLLTDFQKRAFGAVSSPSILTSSSSGTVITSGEG